jgi:hypothetical protein
MWGHGVLNIQESVVVASGIERCVVVVSLLPQ